MTRGEMEERLLKVRYDTERDKQREREREIKNYDNGRKDKTKTIERDK